MRANPAVAFLSSSDRTDTTFECRPASSFAGDARAGYWVFKAFQWLESLPWLP